MKSPALHDTVYAHPISNGIIMNVTSKSAIAKCVSIVSILDGLLNRRFNKSTSTVIFPIDDNTINILKLQRKRQELRKKYNMKYRWVVDNFA